MTSPRLTVERVATAITLVLVVAIAFQLAWWGWYFFAPRASVIATPDTRSATDRSLARTLLGDSGGATASASDRSSASASGIRLKGVFAVDGKTLSAAVINIGGRDLSLRIDESISDGVKLVEVRPDHIIVARGGVREKIEIDRMSAANTAASAAVNKAPPAASFRLNVASSSRNAYSLSRSELNNVLQDPNQINFLGNIAAASTGGVQVKDAPAGSLAQKLGLQPGDIISSINGQPVSGPGDLARFYGQFGSTSSIRAEVRRGGSPMLLTYAINP